MFINNSGKEKAEKNKIDDIVSCFEIFSNIC